MSIPIPIPATLAQRFAAGLAQVTFTASDGTSVTLDATAPGTLEEALSVLRATGDYETYVYMRDLGLELMVTTATENGLLPQHAQVWKVPRLGASAAVGNFVVTASLALTVPAGTLFTAGGIQWSANAATSIAANAGASVAVTAVATGTSGNLAADATAQLVSPIAGVTSVTSDQNGIAGGAPVEPVESWRARIIAEIRAPFGGGTDADYVQWAKNAGAAYVNVVRQWTGLGTVGVMVAMSGGVAPTPAQVASIQSYIDEERPIRGNVTVYAAQIVPQNLTIALNPNTVAAQAAVQAALAPFFLSLGIGNGSGGAGTVYVEAIEGVISSVAGNQNDLQVPTADVALAANQMAVLGTISWANPS